MHLAFNGRMNTFLIIYQIIKYTEKTSSFFKIHIYFASYNIVINAS